MKLTLFFYAILLTRPTRPHKLLWLALKMVPSACLWRIAIVHLYAAGCKRAHII